MDSVLGAVVPILLLTAGIIIVWRNQRVALSRSAASAARIHVAEQESAPLCEHQQPSDRTASSQSTRDDLAAPAHVSAPAASYNVDQEPVHSNVDTVAVDEPRAQSVTAQPAGHLVSQIDTLGSAPEHTRSPSITSAVPAAAPPRAPAPDDADGRRTGADTRAQRKPGAAAGQRSSAQSVSAVAGRRAPSMAVSAHTHTSTGTSAPWTDALAAMPPRVRLEITRTLAQDEELMRTHPLYRAGPSSHTHTYTHTRTFKALSQPRTGLAASAAAVLMSTGERDLDALRVSAAKAREVSQAVRGGGDTEKADGRRGTGSLASDIGTAGTSSTRGAGAPPITHTRDVLLGLLHDALADAGVDRDDMQRILSQAMHDTDLSACFRAQLASHLARRMRAGEDVFAMERSDVRRSRFAGIAELISGDVEAACTREWERVQSGGTAAPASAPASTTVSVDDDLLAAALHELLE